ncbi:hypothetical protein QUA81_33290, partial [Microcoleus sp. F6_B4]
MNLSENIHLNITQHFCFHFIQIVQHHLDIGKQIESRGDIIPRPSQLIRVDACVTTGHLSFRTRTCSFHCIR